MNYDPSQPFGVTKKMYKYLTENSSGYWLIYLISVELLTKRAEQKISSVEHLTLLWGCAPTIQREIEGRLGEGSDLS